ncbi:hypothetical protein ACHAQJ_004543 [Trichoderma viride]
MACKSNSPLPKVSKREPEIFDRLFKRDVEDLNWMKRTINNHVKVCIKYQGADPPQWKEALREVQEATAIAVAEGMKIIESKLNFYAAQCYEGLHLWKEAYKFYSDCTVEAEDAHRLKPLLMNCKRNVERQRDPELRRIKGSDNLHMAYSEDEVPGKVPFRRGW